MAGRGGTPGRAWRPITLFTEWPREFALARVSLACGTRYWFYRPSFVQRDAESGGIGIGMSVVIFHPFGVLIHTSTMMNGFGMGC